MPQVPSTYIHLPGHANRHPDTQTCMTVAPDTPSFYKFSPMNPYPVQSSTHS